MQDDSRIVVLVRTHLTSGEDGEARHAIEAQARTLRDLEGFLGHVLHREVGVFRQMDPEYDSNWLELAFFRNMAPAAAADWAGCPAGASVELLRAEIMLPTPASYNGPLLGSPVHMDRDGVQLSLEYIDVEPAELDRYRDVMKNYCGPAGAKLTQEGVLGSFRALESLATLHLSQRKQAPWNQIHLFEVCTQPFEPFFKAFDGAIRSVSGSDFDTVFGGLDKIRRVSRWAFCE